jgi:S1-C subfamily serine protease
MTTRTGLRADSATPATDLPADGAAAATEPRPGAATPLVRRRARSPVALLAAVLIGAAALVAVVAFSDGSAPTESPAVAPLRVTSGHEVATGFAVGADRIVTVAHVLGGPLAANGRPARLVRADRRSDLALVSVPGLDAPARAAGSAAPATESALAGAPARVLRLRGGHLSALSVHIRRAIVAHVRTAGARRAVMRPALELAARVRAGDSGAPVVSRSGALVGVIFAASSGRENTAYAVDASALTRLLARH